MHWDAAGACGIGRRPCRVRDVSALRLDASGCGGVLRCDIVRMRSMGPCGAWAGVEADAELCADALGMGLRDALRREGPLLDGLDNSGAAPLREGPAIIYSRGARPNRSMTRSNRSDGLHSMAAPLPGRASGTGRMSLLGTQNPASKTPLLRKQDAECGILQGASAGKTNEWLADSEIEDGLSPNAPNATWARRGLFGRGGASRPRPNSTGSLCGRDFWQSRPGGFG